MNTHREWDAENWKAESARAAGAALGAPDEEACWRNMVAACRRVMRTFTTSFFIVSRFLPPRKRDRVEAVYAAVRYPDEVVDSFPLPPGEKLALLEDWGSGYETALKTEGCSKMVRRGVSPFLAPFVHVVRESGIPPEHYRAFLDAMRLDAKPRPFVSMEDLIDTYVYGSAVVVGYFLTYVYGSRTPGELPDALEAARDLGIGLQLTNFVRDVAEDARRGRCYLPLDLLRAEGIDALDVHDPGQHPAIVRAIRSMAETAEERYRRAEAGLEAFAPDCRVAIKACIDVYGMLNRRILAGPSLQRRESVPIQDKLRPLPISKYWRIPLAYLQP